MTISGPAPERAVIDHNLNPAELQALVEHLPYFTVILDSERRFVWFNRLDSTLQRQDVIGQRVEAFTPPEYHGVAIEVVERCLKEGVPGYYEVLGYGEGAYATWYSCRVVPLPPDQNGEPRAMVLTQDISERVRTANALAESEMRFRQLVETSPDVIATLDEHRRLVYLNHHAAKVPVDVASLRGRDLAELIAEEDRTRVVELVDQALTSRSPTTFECTSLLGGRRYRLRLMPLPCDVPGFGAERALLVATDVSEERQAEERMRAMMAELDHRVKNTLATIVAMARQTLDKSSSLEEFRGSFVGRIESMARAHEALAASRWTEVQVERIVRDALAPYVNDYGKVVKNTPQLTLPAVVVAPLAMVLHELVTNAVKHGALSRAEQSLEVRLSVEEPELCLDWYECGVEQPTEPVRNGFGMALVRGVVERQLNGRFEAECGLHDRRYRMRIPINAEAR